HIYKMRLLLVTLTILVSSFAASSQVPIATGIEILKAEDSRRYDRVLEGLMKSPNAVIRERVALAAGRIGDDRAIPALAALLDKDPSEAVRAMAAFAIGEVESIKGAPALLRAATAEYSTRTGPGHPRVLARIVEAEGKVAAANPKDPQTKDLNASIKFLLIGMPSEVDVAYLALTAALRARPDGVAPVVATFLKAHDPRLRAAALNTLTRLKAKESLTDIRALLGHDADPIVRANAARALGAADDKDAIEPLLNAATQDVDSRVRIAATRSLGTLKDVRVTDRLAEHGEQLLAAAKRSRYKHPIENAEMIEVATVLGHLLAGTANATALKFLDGFAPLDGGMTAEVSIARFKIRPDDSFENSTKSTMDWHEMSTDAQVLGTIADLDPKTPEEVKMKEDAPGLLLALLTVASEPGKGDDKKSYIAMPDVLTAYAKFKEPQLDEVLRSALEAQDVQLRATAAGLLAERPAQTENVTALKTAFTGAFVKDKHDDDAVLAILDALFRLNKKESVGSLLVALSSPDYLVRKKAFELLADPEVQKASPGVPTLVENARAKHRDQVLPYSPAAGTHLGQVLNTDADYRRALLRKNGSVRAVLTTEKGVFTIDFDPEEAPLTVDNFIKLARAGHFNGLEVHRVVPNFVMQDGDPRGDGNGGPGWSIRCEINLLPYDRGAVGMALSGKDTGGSQWFVTHSPQPHLDGGYTVFGHVAEKEMKVVDSIVRGDRILSVRVIEGASPQRTQRTLRAR
ncbi:MAG: peptidylprolyl isomerase, partial [Pyrinomonadaceae bacterium]